MRKKRALVIAVLVCVVGFALLEGHWARRWNATCHPLRVAIAQTDRQDLASATGAVEDVDLTASDGVVLHGWFVPPKNGCVVVMGHGLGETRTRFLFDAKMLARHGCGALLFDWRAHGESGGDTATWGDREQLDFSAAIGFAAKRPDVDPTRIVGCGFSIGASAVAVEAASDPRVRGVILLAVWPSLSDEIDYKARHFGALSRLPARWGIAHAGVDFDRVRPIDVIGKIAPRPLLLVTGDADTDTPLAVEERVFAAAAEPKEMWVVHGSDHGGYQAKDPASYEQHVVRFLEQNHFSL